MDAMESLVDADAVAWLDALSRDALTPGRLAAAADVAAAVLTPCAVRRRRAGRPASPDGEYVAANSRGGKWGIEAHRRGWRDARRLAKSRGGSPVATWDGGLAAVGAPAATIESALGTPTSTLDLLGDPTATMDAVWDDLLAASARAAAADAQAGREGATPQCAVNQLVMALRTFWTPERIDGCVGGARKGRVLVGGRV
jgi:hypothetical protein